MGTRHQEPQKIKFTPLSDGLGFHPFSDGLPYAPVTKAPQPTRRFSPDSAGAVSAGPATFARVSVPIAAPAQRKTAITLSPMPDLAPNLIAERPGLGYLFKRFLAYVVDFGVNTALCGGGFIGLLIHENISLNVFTGPGAAILGGAFLLVFNWAMVTAQEVAFGTTVGKHLFGLVLRGSVWAILGRAILFNVSLIAGGLGLWWAVFNRERRCWHDSAADLQPSEAAKL